MNVHLTQLKHTFPTTFSTREEVDKAVDRIRGPGIKLAILKSKEALEKEYFSLLEQMAELATIIDDTNALRNGRFMEPITYNFPEENCQTMAQKAGVEDLYNGGRLENYSSLPIDQINHVVIVAESVEESKDLLEQYLKTHPIDKTDTINVYTKETEMDYYTRLLGHRPNFNLDKFHNTTIHNDFAATYKNECHITDFKGPYSNRSIGILLLYKLGKTLLLSIISYILSKRTVIIMNSDQKSLYELVRENFPCETVYNKYISGLLAIRFSPVKQVDWQKDIYIFRCETKRIEKPSNIVSIHRLKEYLCNITGDYKYQSSSTSNFDCLFYYDSNGDFNTLLELYKKNYQTWLGLVKKLYGVKPFRKLSACSIKELNNLVYQENNRLIPIDRPTGSTMDSDIQSLVDDSNLIHVGPTRVETLECYNGFDKFNKYTEYEYVPIDSLGALEENIHVLRDMNKLVTADMTILDCSYNNQHYYIIGSTDKFNDKYKSILIDIAASIFPTNNLEDDEPSNVSIYTYGKFKNPKDIVNTYFNKMVSHNKGYSEYLEQKLDMLVEYDTFTEQFGTKKTIIHTAVSTNHGSNIPAIDRDTICAHISNGLKFNETHENYMTYCRNCMVSYKVDKQQTKKEIIYYDSFSASSSSSSNSLFGNMKVFTSRSGYNNTLETPKDEPAVQTNNLDVVYSKSRQLALVLVNKDRDIVKDICNSFPELIYICGKIAIPDQQKCDIEDKIHLQAFIGVDQIKNMLEQLGQEQTSEADKVKSYIKNNYILNNDISNRIGATSLLNQILSGLELNADANKHGFSKRIAEYMDQLGCKKKRYSDGIYYYGLLPKN